MTTFFISYNQADRQWAEWIAWELEAAGHATFIQAWDIRPGANFVLAMQDATARAERTVAVLSPDYVEAKFTQPEWSAAFAQDPTGERGVLVPVKVRQVELRGMWVSIVYIDLVGLTHDKAKQALLGGITAGRSKPAEVAYPGDIAFSALPTSLPPSFPLAETGAKDPFADWAVLDVTATDEGGVSFLFRPESTRMTELQRLELTTDQRMLVDALVEQATTSILADDFQVVLFELLIPPSLKDALRRSARLRLLVDEKTASYPWELLTASTPVSGAPGLALSSRLIRCLSVSRLRLVKYANKKTGALVVGNPLQTKYPDLPGAAREAHAIGEVLAGTCTSNVRLAIGAPGVTILSEMYSEPYQILHIAARATFEDGRAGIVIDDEMRITAREFEQLRSLPDVVFLNFGHRQFGEAPSGGDPKSSDFISIGRIAANFAADLITAGVPAVIVSGLFVDDAASVTFVTELYRALSVGDTLAVSVHKARQLTYELHSRVTTWGAFHCYGDPDFSLAHPNRNDRHGFLKASQ